MSLIINHNLMAMNAARNLTDTFGRLSTSTQRLSSGMRINSAADDAAGLAIRELMRADIAVLNQGIRNASDAISLIQTGEGAMSVIDEKLIRMKELAEQASTGTYTTAQREIMNSEYQAMAAEIDRIANATDFNGVKLLDGSLAQQHGGSGMKIHFGTGNSAAEDYYYVKIGDMRATEASGLRVGNSDTGDILRTNNFDAANPTVALGGTDGVFGVQYTTDGGTTWSTFGYVTVDASADSLLDVVDTINAGAAATGTMTFGAATGLTSIYSGSLTIGNTVFSFSSAVDPGSSTYTGATNTAVVGTSAISGASIVRELVSLINANAASIGVYAGANSGASVVYLTGYTMGDTSEIITAGSGTSMTVGQSNLTGAGGTNVKADLYYDTSGENYELELRGSLVGVNNQIRVVTAFGSVVDGSRTEQRLLTNYTETNFVDTYSKANADADWTETQNASGTTNWNGKDILTQSGAQLALEQIDGAISDKDTTRANLGAVVNRLENTITNLQIQAENLQAAESRISDVDVATEMTEFTKNNIMAQAAVAMLAQANSLPQLALQLLGG